MKIVVKRWNDKDDNEHQIVEVDGYAVMHVKEVIGGHNEIINNVDGSYIAHLIHHAFKEGVRTYGNVMLEEQWVEDEEQK